jgi:hypothetical protein
MTYLLKKEEMKLELVKTYRQSHVAETISLSIALSFPTTFLTWRRPPINNTTTKTEARTLIEFFSRLPFRQNARINRQVTIISIIYFTPAASGWLS